MEVASGPQVFTFEHNSHYQQGQFEFWDAVESLNPQNIVVSTRYSIHTSLRFMCVGVYVCVEVCVGGGICV